MDLLDSVRVLLAAGVTIYAFLSYLKLQGGTMSVPYLVFTVCGFVGACSAASDALNLELAHGLFGILFYCLLFVGFWSVYRTWSRIGK